MANEEQLNILKQGVDVWNAWRQEHPEVTINLIEADLCYADLRNADLRNADLTAANLRKTGLYKADLTGANLHNADLREASLVGASLVGANLTGGALFEAKLLFTDLRNATLTGACLYGTARDDWKIDGVQCDYISWDIAGVGCTPQNRDFRPGEFEELYKQLPTFDYVFKHGFTPIDAVVMNRVVEAVNERHPEFRLDLVNFDKRGEPHATFTVLHKEAVEAAKQEVARNYEDRLAALEGKQEQMMQLMTALVNNPKKIEVIMGNKQISAGQDYIESIAGDNFKSGGNMNIAKDHGSASQSNDTGRSELK